MNDDAQVQSDHVENDTQDREFEIPVNSELERIRELTEEKQEEPDHEIDIPGWDGKWVISCKPPTDHEWNRVEKQLSKAGKKDDLASRNMKLNVLINGTREVRYRREGATETSSLQEVFPEIVGTDEVEIRFGDPRLTEMLEAAGMQRAEGARAQLLTLLKNPIRVVNFFTEYYEWASGELEEINDDLLGESEAAS